MDKNGQGDTFFFHKDSIPFIIQGMLQSKEPHNNAARRHVSTTTTAGRTFLSSTSTPYYREGMEISLSIDPASTVRLATIVIQASSGFLGAFLGTLRLLAPMIVARRRLL